jgi:hypothetical protein
MSYGCKCECQDFREHALGVSFAASAMPTRRGEAARISATESQWAKDGDAYKRLRRQGLQPKDVDGAAQLEKHATDKLEIERGKIYGETGVRLRKEAAEQIAEGTS